MDPVRVVDSNVTPIENRRSIGNGSKGNVIVWQYNYEFAGKTGVASSLTAVQVTDLVEYTPTQTDDFSAIESAASEAPAPKAEDLF